MTTETFHLAIVIIGTVLVLMQLAVLGAITFGLLKLTRTAHEKTGEITATILPIITSSRELVQTANQLMTRLEPRLDAAATDLAEITRGARAQAARFETTATDLQRRVQGQAARIDGMATSLLDSVDYATEKVGTALRGPARRISGTISAVSAFFETLNKPLQRKVATPPPAAPSVHQNKDVAV